MSINTRDLQSMFQSAAANVIAAKDELTEIDSRFGDADHGITMEKLAQKIEEIADQADPYETVKQFLICVSSGVLSLSGGSAVPLWGTFLKGMANAAPEADTIDADDLKAIFAAGLQRLQKLTPAKVGDKTMMDALIPAIGAITAAESDIPSMLAAGAAAAAAGAEDSKNYVSKFGRARSYKEQTLGTSDAGAVSMAVFFAGLAKTQLV